MSIMSVVLLPWLGVALVLAGAILLPSWKASHASGLNPFNASLDTSAMRRTAGGLLITIGLLVVVDPVLLFAFQSVQHADEQDRLPQTGVSAPATILDFWDTNTTINNSPVIGIRRDVRPERGPPFRAETTQMVSRLQVSLFQPGVQATVKYDPRDTSKAVVVSVR